MELNLELLSIQNPWWKNNIVKNDPIIRGYIEQSLKWHPPLLANFQLDKDWIYILYGPRNIGKSTILKLLIQKLIEDNINPNNILYYSCHNVDSYEQLNEAIKIFLHSHRSRQSQRLYIFIDEISLIKNWQKGINYLLHAGKLKNCVLFLASSVFPGIKANNSQLVQGTEKTEVILNTLSFEQFLSLLNHELHSTVTRKNYLSQASRLDYYLDIYFLTGGNFSSINSYYKNGAVSEYFYQDHVRDMALDMAKVGRNEILWRQIMENVINNLGQKVGYQTIARKTKAKLHVTIAEYLEILEAMSILKMVCQSDREGKATTSKAKKIYFGDPFSFWAMLSYIYGSIDAWHFSKEKLHQEDIYKILVENIIFSHIVRNETWENRGKGVTFWRDNAKKIEFDFLVRDQNQIVPILIKRGKGIEDKDIRSFAQAGFRKGIIISQDTLDMSGSIKIMPLTYFLLFNNFVGEEKEGR